MSQHSAQEIERLKKFVRNVGRAIRKADSAPSYSEQSLANAWERKAWAKVKSSSERVYRVAVTGRDFPMLRGSSMGGSIAKEYLRR